MSFLCRGVWPEKRPNLTVAAFGQFQGWIQSKNIEVPVPEEGHAEGADEYGLFEILTRRAAPTSGGR